MEPLEQAWSRRLLRHGARPLGVSPQPHAQPNLLGLKSAYHLGDERHPLPWLCQLRLDNVSLYQPRGATVVPA